MQRCAAHGFDGAGPVGPAVGGTAALIAESAFCAVAAIRHHRPQQQTVGDRRVVAVFDESPVSIGVWRTALGEARCQRAPILALTFWPERASSRHAADADHGLRDELDRYLDDGAGAEPSFR